MPDNFSFSGFGITTNNKWLVLLVLVGLGGGFAYREFAVHPGEDGRAVLAEINRDLQAKLEEADRHLGSTPQVLFSEPNFVVSMYPNDRCLLIQEGPVSRLVLAPARSERPPVITELGHERLRMTMDPPRWYTDVASMTKALAATLNPPISGRCVDPHPGAPATIESMGRKGCWDLQRWSYKDGCVGDTQQNVCNGDYEHTVEGKRKMYWRNCGH